LACQQDRDPSQNPAGDVLRVSTHHGIVPMSPLADSSMTSHLIDLVYPKALKDAVAETHRSGRVVRLVVRSPEANATLVADRIRHPEMVHVRVDGADVVMEFRSEEAAEALNLEMHLLETGPFQAAESSDTQLTLERRNGEHGVRVIEVIDMGSDDVEWRRLMAGDVDLMPIAMMSALPGLGEVPDLRVVAYADPATVGLMFRVDGGPTADHSVREAIALAIRRGALSEVAVGDARFAVDMPEDAAEARAILARGPGRLRLRLLIPKGEADFQRAALVIEQQLAALEIDVDLLALDNAEMVERFSRRDFEMMIFYGSYDARYFHYFAGPAPVSITGYSDAEFNAAVSAGRHAEASAMLARDLPVTPLFRMREAAVVNRRFCNVKPIVNFNMSWLADVRPCAPGEDE
jgi:ABC-type transport system substrate-binding protein